MQELRLNLVKAVDTHLHADHITGLGALRDRTRCITVMGEQSGVDVVSMRVADGDQLEIEELALDGQRQKFHRDAYLYLQYQSGWHGFDWPGLSNGANWRLSAAAGCRYRTGYGAG
jgi:glyoxylase-like metal-dependent hydrolase (beta-lactamase superfamily II)